MTRIRPGQNRLSAWTRCPLYNVPTLDRLYTLDCFYATKKCTTMMLSIHSWHFWDSYYNRLLSRINTGYSITRGKLCSNFKMLWVFLIAYDAYFWFTLLIYVQNCIICLIKLMQSFNLIPAGGRQNDSQRNKI